MDGDLKTKEYEGQTDIVKLSLFFNFCDSYTKAILVLYN